MLGFYLLTQELDDHFAWRQMSQKESKERFLAALQQMSATSEDEKVDDVKSLTKKYHKYKRKYVKHLSFNPEEKKYSKSAST